MTSLWAPYADVVELELTASGERRRLVRAEDGWWRDRAAHRGPYRFVVDGVAIADPRSPNQPAGLDGPSATDDPTSFPWTDGAWRGFPLRDAVLDELHVGTFSDEGTFAGVIAHLDDLVAVGVNAIELMPVATFPGARGWGYDGALLAAPHHTYGSPDELRALVDAAHARGVAVVLDVVYNHLGPTGNHLGMLGPYFTDRYPTPWGAAINLDGPGSDEVRRFFVDNALHWVRDHHVDGLRLDAVHALRDASAIHLLEEIAEAVHAAAEQAGRTVWVIAESDLNDPRLVRDPEQGGFGLDAAWSDDFHHALHVALTGERNGYYADYEGWPDVATCLNQVWVYDGRPASTRGRRHGRPAGDVPRHRFVGYGQNHDQVGNRALGERMEHLAGRRGAEIAAALVLTAPFVPMLFQGEEWAASSPFLYFTDHDDPDVAAATREGRKAEFAGFESFTGGVPDPQAVETFERSRLRWAEREQPEHASMLDWYRRLIGLRATCPDLRSDAPDDTVARYDEATRSLRVQRARAVVAVNTADVPASIAVGDGVVLGATNDPGAVVADGWLALAPYSVAVLVPEPAVA